MAKKNLRERLRRYLERLERRTNVPDAPPVVVRFMEGDGEGGVAALGHVQAVLSNAGLGPLEPYLLTPKEEAERQEKLAAWKAEEEARKMDNLMRKPSGGTVQ